jgi:hypothetical protein
MILYRISEGAVGVFAEMNLFENISIVEIVGFGCGTDGSSH